MQLPLRKKEGRMNISRYHFFYKYVREVTIKRKEK